MVYSILRKTVKFGILEETLQRSLEKGILFKKRVHCIA